MPTVWPGWLGEVEGVLRVGGEFRAHINTSRWEGTGRVEACEPPRSGWIDSRMKLRSLRAWRDEHRRMSEPGGRLCACPSS
jgi:hypothetical protein